MRNRWQVGLPLALTAALAWGLVPIALTLVLTGLDPYTITWFRFLTAALVLGAGLALTGGLPAVGEFRARDWYLILVALAGLVSNFVLFPVALSYVTPTVGQVVNQLQPVLLLLGSVAVFRERLSRGQWAGFAVLLLGLLLFFNHRLPELGRLDEGFGHGVALLVLGSVAWAIYGLAQKQLLHRWKSPQILVLCYIGAAIALAAVARPAGILRLTTLQACMLAFLCGNTLIGYGAFAEALKHWQASRVGAVLAVTPLCTMGGMWLIDRISPDLVTPEHLGAVSVIGALLVVGGSAICAVGGNHRVET